MKYIEFINFILLEYQIDCMYIEFINFILLEYQIDCMYWDIWPYHYKNKCIIIQCLISDWYTIHSMHGLAT